MFQLTTDSHRLTFKRKVLRIGQNTKKFNRTMTIRCRDCGGDHFTMRCPLRSPGNRSTKQWHLTVEEFEASERAKQFQCVVPMHPGKFSTARGHTVQEFWEDIRVSHQHSLYLDFSGIQNKDTSRDQAILPMDHPSVEPGHYRPG